MGFLQKLARNRRDREAALWLASRKGGEPTGDFEAWMADPANRGRYDHLESTWEDEALTLALRRVEHRAKRNRRAAPLSWLPVPAGAAAMAALAFFAGPQVELWTAEVQEKTTLPGQTAHLDLADGSRIDMAGGSQVRVRMTGRRRQVELLHGQAFFTVSPGVDRPFQVITHDSRVVVVGTRFDVAALSGGTELAVEEGRVRFGGRGMFDSNRLVEGGQGSRVAHGETAAPASLEQKPAGGWRSGWIEAQDTPLAEVVETLNLWSPRKVALADPALGDLTVTGRFRVTRPERTLENIARLHGLQLRRRADTLLLERHATVGKNS
ncbi:FecR domain-containing protein [Caulobacter sp. 73W]|uniref:FecR domain-containing protein n=1 Tax=Caulobacter sp. 73W TaxID=3161137 RepID=A0AB39KWF8_9CAUL